MVSDSIVASAASKDFAKKKRVNRSAKLKQCKLDARREQWLSQGAAAKKRGTIEELGARQRENENQRKVGIENLETRRSQDSEKENSNDGGSIYHDFDSDSPSNSPTSSSVLSSADGGTSFAGSSSSSSSSSSTVSGGCCSGCITEEEGEEGEGDADDNCLDDWEAVADALAADDDNKQPVNNDSPCLEESSSHLLNADSASSQEDLKQEEQRRVPTRVASGKSRAWRHDDASRPQSLPNLSKQLTFPTADRRYGHGGSWCSSNVVNVPTSCPICCEDLDGTDTSFLPCICGFRLCLFCYNRIQQVDGRCPSCRKNYEDSPMHSELSDSGGCMMFRLPRSYSMVARSS